MAGNMPTPLALLLGVPAPVAAPLEDAMVSVEPFSRRDGMDDAGSSS